MALYPLRLVKGHVFMEIGGKFWLVDTGAPSSFGAQESVVLEGKTFPLGESFLGMTVGELEGYVGVECAGLLGADVLAEFNFVFDLPEERAEVSESDLALDGVEVGIDFFMGVPLVDAVVRGRQRRMFFDTGAQISYLQSGEFESFPLDGTFADFYPGYGKFQTETRLVEVSLGGLAFTLQTGKLPGILGESLMMAGAEGIIGNEVMRERKVGYFPGKRLLVL